MEYKEWRLHGILHRVDGPAVEYENGDKYWYQHGFLHREDGPSIECSGVKYWHQYGKLHRINGPAVEYSNGDEAWWQYGTPIDPPDVKQIKINWKQEGF